MGQKTSRPNTSGVIYSGSPDDDHAFQSTYFYPVFGTPTHITSFIASTTFLNTANHPTGSFILFPHHRPISSLISNNQLLESFSAEQTYFPPGAVKNSRNAKIQQFLTNRDKLLAVGMENPDQGYLVQQPYYIRQIEVDVEQHNSRALSEETAPFKRILETSPSAPDRTSSAPTIQLPQSLPSAPSSTPRISVFHGGSMTQKTPLSVVVPTPAPGSASPAFSATPAASNAPLSPSSPSVGIGSTSPTTSPIVSVAFPPLSPLNLTPTAATEPMQALEECNDVDNEGGVDTVAPLNTTTHPTAANATIIPAPIPLPLLQPVSQNLSQPQPLPLPSHIPFLLLSVLQPQPEMQSDRAFCSLPNPANKTFHAWSPDATKAMLPLHIPPQRPALAPMFTNTPYTGLAGRENGREQQTDQQLFKHVELPTPTVFQCTPCVEYDFGRFAKLPLVNHVPAHHIATILIIDPTQINSQLVLSNFIRQTIDFKLKGCHFQLTNVPLYLLLCNSNDIDNHIIKLEDIYNQLALIGFETVLQYNINLNPSIRDLIPEYSPPLTYSPNNEMILFDRLAPMIDIEPILDQLWSGILTKHFQLLGQGYFTPRDTHNYELVSPHKWPMSYYTESLAVKVGGLGENAISLFTKPPSAIDTSFEKGLKSTHPITQISRAAVYHFQQWLMSHHGLHGGMVYPKIPFGGMNWGMSSTYFSTSNIIHISNPLPQPFPQNFSPILHGIGTPIPSNYYPPFVTKTSPLINPKIKPKIQGIDWKLGRVGIINKPDDQYPALKTYTLPEILPIEQLPNQHHFDAFIMVLPSVLKVDVGNVLHGTKYTLPIDTQTISYTAGRGGHNNRFNRYGNGTNNADEINSKINEPNTMTPTRYSGEIAPKVDKKSHIPSILKQFDDMAMREVPYDYKTRKTRVSDMSKRIRRDTWGKMGEIFGPLMASKSPPAEHFFTDGPEHIIPPFLVKKYGDSIKALTYFNSAASFLHFPNIVNTNGTTTSTDDSTDPLPVQININYLTRRPDDVEGFAPYPKTPKLIKHPILPLSEAEYRQDQPEIETSEHDLSSTRQIQTHQPYYLNHYYNSTLNFLPLAYLYGLLVIPFVYNNDRPLKLAEKAGLVTTTVDYTQQSKNRGHIGSKPYDEVLKLSPKELGMGEAELLNTTNKGEVLPSTSTYPSNFIPPPIPSLESVLPNYISNARIAPGESVQMGSKITNLVNSWGLTTCGPLSGLSRGLSPAHLNSPFHIVVVCVNPFEDEKKEIDVRLAARREAEKIEKAKRREAKKLTKTGGKSSSKTAKRNGLPGGLDLPTDGRDGDNEKNRDQTKKKEWGEKLDPITKDQYRYWKEQIPGLYHRKLIMSEVALSSFVTAEKLEQLWKVHFITLNEWESTFSKIEADAVDTRLQMYQDMAGLAQQRLLEAERIKEEEVEKAQQPAQPQPISQ